VNSPVSERERRRFLETVALFKKYGEEYGFDPLMLAAQAYQESGLDQRKLSARGAVGVMQVMPDTARAMNVGDIHRLEPNIHAGIKYLRELADGTSPIPASMPSTARCSLSPPTTPDPHGSRRCGTKHSRAG